MRAIFVGTFEQRMGDLAGHHVDLVGLGHRNDHVRVRRPGLLQDRRAGSVADQSLDVQRVGQPADQLPRLVDDGDVVGFGGQIAGDVLADLSGAADNDLMMG